MPYFSCYCMMYRVLMVNYVVLLAGRVEVAKAVTISTPRWVPSRLHSLTPLTSARGLLILLQNLTRRIRRRESLINHIWLLFFWNCHNSLTLLVVDLDSHWTRWFCCVISPVDLNQFLTCIKEQYCLSWTIVANLHVRWKIILVKTAWQLCTDLVTIRNVT